MDGHGSEDFGGAVLSIGCHTAAARALENGEKFEEASRGKNCQELLTDPFVRLPWSQHQKDERALWLASIWPHGPLKKQAIAAMVRDYKLLAGVERPGRTHLWRHTCATHMVQGGANLAYVQRLLGHRSLETTAIYTRVSAAEVADTIRRKHPRRRA